MSRKGSAVPNAPPPPAGVLVNNDRSYSVVAETISMFTDLSSRARRKETSMDFMECYDTNLLGSFAFPVFNQQFGIQLSSGQYQVSAAWQRVLMDGAQLGAMIGLALNGVICDRIGYQKTYFYALAMMTAFIFLPFFAKSNILLLAGQILSGILWVCLSEQYRVPVIADFICRVCSKFCQWHTLPKSVPCRFVGT